MSTILRPVRSQQPVRLHETVPAARRWLHRSSAAVALATAGSVLAFGALGPLSAPPPGRASAPGHPALRLTAGHPHHWRGHPGRRLVSYRVRPGDTATGLAVRFHAWTRELRALNHLGPAGTLFVGQHVRIPVVLAAVAHAKRHNAKRHRHGSSGSARHAGRHRKRDRARPHSARHGRVRHHPWRHADASRATVRRVIVRTARRHHMEPASALAIAWQESGWQQRRISPAGAIGALQVMPDTGRWMSTYVDRPLNLYALGDNVTAGVALFRVLRGQTSWRRSVAAYYEGLGALQEHGMYRDTVRYTRNVSALRKRLRHGWNPY